MEAWVTTLEEDADCWSALALVESLIENKTTKLISVFTGRNISIEMRFLLGHFFDLVQPLPNSGSINSDLENFTPWTKCLILEPKSIALENIDGLFNQNSHQTKNNSTDGIELVVWMRSKNSSSIRIKSSKLIQAETDSEIFRTYLVDSLSKIDEMEPSIKDTILKSFPIPLIKISPGPKPPRDMTPPDALAIVGMSCRFPGANTLEEYWDILANGKHTVTRFPLDRVTFDIPGIQESVAGFLSCPIDEFDADFFDINPSEAWLIDPQQRILLEVAWEGLEDAGIDAATLRGTNGGVFVGNLLQDYDRMIPENELLGLGSPAEVGRLRTIGNSLSGLSGRISNFLGLRGPSISHEAGCSSGLGALHLACESLLRGECNIAISGAVNLVLLPRAYNTAVLSSDFKCKTFDASADGFVSGEAAGTFVVKRYADAVRDGDRIRAIIRGTAMSNDGASLCYGTPNPEAHARTHKLAMAKAGVQPWEVSYVETHGTGTQKGDIGEVFGLADAYGVNRRSPLLIGSVKQNIGHGEAAAAMGSAIKLVLALQREAIPPNIFLTQVNPKIDLDAIPAQIPTVLTPWSGTGRLAGLSSFSLTGSLVHAIFQSAPPKGRTKFQGPPVQGTQLICISAKTEEALTCQVKNYVKFFQQNCSLPLVDVALATNTCRTHFGHRAAVLASSLSELTQKLEAEDFKTSVLKTVGEEIKVAPPGQNQRELRAYLEELGSAYLKGGNLNWSNWFGRMAKGIDLPFYPFQRQKFWFSPTQFPAVLKKRAEEDPKLRKIHPLLGYRIPNPVGAIFQNSTKSELTSGEILEMLIAAPIFGHTNQATQIFLESIEILVHLPHGSIFQTIMEPGGQLGDFKVKVHCLEDGETWKLVASAMCIADFQDLKMAPLFKIENYHLMDFEHSEEGFLLAPGILETAITGLVKHEPLPMRIRKCTYTREKPGKTYFRACADGLGQILDEQKKCVIQFEL